MEILFLIIGGVSLFITLFILTYLLSKYLQEVGKEKMTGICPKCGGEMVDETYMEECGDSNEIKFNWVFYRQCINEACGHIIFDEEV